MTQIIKYDQDIILIKERIRDIHYFEEINKFFLFIENSAAIAILEKRIYNFVLSKYK